MIQIPWAWASFSTCLPEDSYRFSQYNRAHHKAKARSQKTAGDQGQVSSNSWKMGGAKAQQEVKDLPLSCFKLAVHEMYYNFQVLFFLNGIF